MAGLWNVAKEAARAAKGLMSKNARNAAEAEAKKERGPVKAFFHITKNENVPAIEQQGLLTDHPNANVNSAAHPFRKHGTDAGGVWVTTKPTAFPVYGTTVGGKRGNEAARADALSTIKIEVPLPELAKMKAVQDPYGSNILRKGDDPRAIDKSLTWAGIDVPTTVLLNDVKPQWLKNIGYVEESNIPYDAGYYKLPRLYGQRPTSRTVKSQEFQLNKADRKALSGNTGHKATYLSGKFNYDKSPARFVGDYLDRNRPITERLPELPDDKNNLAGVLQFTSDRLNTLGTSIVRIGHYRKQLRQPPTAGDWTINFKPYSKLGELPKKITFQPGAYSRGMGTIPVENIRINMGDEIKGRHFNWNTYLKSLQNGMSPEGAASQAAPRYYLDWDNIVYNPRLGYMPNKVWPENTGFNFNKGAISRGRPESLVRTEIGEPINLRQLNSIRHSPIGDIVRPHIIDQLNLTDAAASDVLLIPKDATWNDIIRAVMKANVKTE